MVRSTTLFLLGFAISDKGAQNMSQSRVYKEAANPKRSPDGHQTVTKTTKPQKQKGRSFLIGLFH
jgi:hypothetical protein